jgi:hypothetical protein
MATIVIGAQWGDEGKGKLVDILCPTVKLCARAQGGNNAGHTMYSRSQFQYSTKISAYTSAVSQMAPYTISIYFRPVSSIQSAQISLGLEWWFMCRHSLMS